MQFLGCVKRIIMLNIACFVILSCTVCFASENPYLDENFWSANDANSIELNKTGMSYKLDGSFQYISDENNGIFAVCFNIDETSIPTYGNNIKISYYITSESENFHLCIDENGIFQCDGDQNSFSFITNFVLRDTGGVYMAVVEFDNKKISRNIEPFLHINDHRYKIVNNELVLESKPTSTKAKATKTKTTSQIITKTKGTIQNDTSTTKSINSTTKETTTKYQPGAKYQANSSTNYVATANSPTTNQTTNQLTESQSAIQISPDISASEQKGSVSKTAKIMMAGGAFCSVIGLCLTVCTAIINKKQAQ